MIDKSDNNELDEITAPAAPEHKKPVKKPRGAGFALFIAFLALFFTAAGIAAGYKHWQRMSDRAKNNARDIAALEEVIAAKSDNKVITALRDEFNNAQAAQQKKVADTLTQVQQMHSQTEQFSATVAAQVKKITALQAQLQSKAEPQAAKDRHFTEVSFLLKLAMRELQLSGNTAAAGSALREADKILSEQASARYLPVRKKIAHDLAALAATETPDLATLSQRITALVQHLKPAFDNDFLPAAPDAQGIPTKDATSAESAQTEAGAASTANNERTSERTDGKAASAWQAYKAKAVKALSDAVVIRPLDDSLAKVFNVEAREQAYQLLQLRLEGLRLMALQQQNTAFQQQLELIRNTVTTYYPPDQVQAILPELEQLAAVNLAPKLPDISGSLRQLEKTRLAEVSQ